MKVSIWQQFSSNHSAHFDIIAKFESVEWANTVADELAKIILECYFLQEDLNEYEDEDEDFDYLWRIVQSILYGYEVRTDWLLNLQHAKRTVQVMDNILLMKDSPGYNNATSIRGMLNMIKATGGEAYTQEETASHDTTINVRATAPDEDTANALIAQAKTTTRYGGQIYYEVEYNGNRLRPAKQIELNGVKITYSDIYMRFEELLDWVYYLKAYNCSHISVQFIEDYFKENTQRTSDWMNFDNVDQIKALWSPKNHAERNHWTRYRHSAIATYKTPEQAKTVADAIQQIIVQVRTWADKNPDEAKTISRTYWERLSPIEEKFRNQYDIEWQHSILEWVLDAMDKNYCDDCVVAIDNHVLVRNKCMSHYGIYPLGNVLRKYKPIKAYIPENYHHLFTFNVHVKLHSNFVAHGLLANFMKQDKFTIRNWLWLYTDDWNTFTAEGGSTTQELRNAVDYHNDYVAQLKKITQAYQYAVDSKNDDDRAIYEQELKQFVQDFPIVQLSKHAMAWRRAYDMNFTFEDIQLVDKELMLGKVRFEKANTFRGLYALIRWLRLHYDKNAYFEIVYPEPD